MVTRLWVHDSPSNVCSTTSGGIHSLTRMTIVKKSRTFMARVNLSPAESQDLQVASFPHAAETQGLPPLQRTEPEADHIRDSAGKYDNWINRHITISENRS